MSKDILRIGPFIFLLLVCVACACESPVETKPAPTPEDCLLRFEFSTTSGWAELDILDPEQVLSFELVSTSGDSSFYGFTETGMSLNQDMESPDDGDTVGITVDYEFAPTACAGTLSFKLEGGDWNSSSTRIYRLVDHEYRFVREVEYCHSTDPDGARYVAFSLDLGGMFAGTTLPGTGDDLGPNVATVIFHSGVVLTMEPDLPRAQAIAIRGERILAVGSNEAIAAYAGADTQSIDLQGHTLLPGLATGHTHVFWVPEGKTLDDIQDLVLSYGYTSLSEMTSDDGHLETLLQAEADGRMRVRVNVFVTYNDSHLDENMTSRLIQYWYPEHGPILDMDHKVRVPGIKIFVDGAGTPSRGCPATREPYPASYTSEEWFQQSCGSTYGDLYWPRQEELNQAVADAQAAGYRVAFHAMGDKGIEAALDAIAFALDGESNLVYRHQIQHSSFLEDDLLQRYLDMDMLSSIRGHFNTCEQDGYHSEAAANRYALPGLGVHAYLETDGGWRNDPTDRSRSNTIDAMVHLWGLVTHKQLRPDGTTCSPDPWIAQHVITVEQALRMMTYEPIFAVSQEDMLGSLAAGKYADLVILSDNPLTVAPDRLKDLEVWMTMVGGTAQYCKDGKEAYCPQ